MTISPPPGKTCLEFLLRILFIYQKLEEGWVIRKTDENSFEFLKAIDENTESFKF